MAVEMYRVWYRDRGFDHPMLLAEDWNTAGRVLSHQYTQTSLSGRLYTHSWSSKSVTPSYTCIKLGSSHCTIMLSEPIFHRNRFSSFEKTVTVRSSPVGLVTLCERYGTRSERSGSSHESVWLQAVVVGTAVEEES